MSLNNKQTANLPSNNTTNPIDRNSTTCFICGKHRFYRSLEEKCDDNGRPYTVALALCHDCGVRVEMPTVNGRLNSDTLKLLLALEALPNIINKIDNAISNEDTNNG